MSARPLRVLRLCSVFEPPDSAIAGRGARFDPIGGMQDHTAALTRLLARRGVDQVVLTTRPPTAPWRQVLGPRASVLRVGLPVRRARQLWALPAAVLAPLLARRADLVHVHLGEDIAVLPLAFLGARRRGLPVVVTVHASPAHTVGVRDVRTALVVALGGPIERWAQRRAAATIVLTERLAARVAPVAGRERVRVMRRGVDRTAFADPGPDPFPELRGRPRVVFLGRLARSKGVDTLVAAAARLRTPGAQVVLVGDGPARAEVEAASRRLDVDGHVHVTGFVPHHRTPAVLASADLLVLPSTYEELGTVLVEALQVGLPAVASNVGGIPEVVEHGRTGMLVPPGDAAALAEAIDAILGDRGLAARMGAAARERAAEYDWERVAGEVCALYDEVVGRAAGAPRAERPRSPGDRLAARLWPPRDGTDPAKRGETCAC
ncbi:MAG TPA: glycosyltransferase [Solirubrobacteraceae bacterium]|nr:glycosyltransferase [Solirubrobacteraceae bacterium]